MSQLCMVAMQISEEEEPGEHSSIPKSISGKLSATVRPVLIKPSGCYYSKSEVRLNPPQPC